MVNLPRSFLDTVEEIRAETAAARRHFFFDGPNALHDMERWRTERVLYEQAGKEWKPKPEDL